MLLLDRVVDVIRDRSATGVKNVTMNEPFFPGHFPDNPVMPGVLIIEALGQTGAVLMAKSLDLTTSDIEGKTILFISIDNARFRNPVRPGDVLRMNVEVTKHRADLFKFHGRAFVNGKVAAEAEFAAMVASPR
jgi:3-hydroxyacyl-[acyl-carrier-protein] dehydratase